MGSDSTDNSVAGRAFRAFNNDNQSQTRSLARDIIDSVARERMNSGDYRYAVQDGLSFKSDPDSVCDDLKYGIDDVDMYMSPKQPGLLCIDIYASTIDHAHVDAPDESPRTLKSANLSWVDIEMELYSRFSSGTEMHDMAVGVTQSDIHSLPPQSGLQQN